MAKTDVSPKGERMPLLDVPRKCLSGLPFSLDYFYSERSQVTSVLQARIAKPAHSRSLIALKYYI